MSFSHGSAWLGEAGASGPMNSAVAWQKRGKVCKSFVLDEADEAGETCLQRLVRAICIHESKRRGEEEKK